MDREKFFRLFNLLPEPRLSRLGRYATVSVQPGIFHICAGIRLAHALTGPIAAIELRRKYLRRGDIYLRSLGLNWFEFRSPQPLTPSTQPAFTLLAFKPDPHRQPSTSLPEPYPDIDWLKLHPLDPSDQLPDY